MSLVYLTGIEHVVISYKNRSRKINIYYKLYKILLRKINQVSGFQKRQMI
jgi:hypothetical protein